MDNSEFKVFEKDLLFKNSPSNERILCMYIKRNKCFTNLFKNAFFCNLKRSLLKAPFLYLLLEKKKKKKLLITLTNGIKYKRLLTDMKTTTMKSLYKVRTF